MLPSGPSNSAFTQREPKARVSQITHLHFFMKNFLEETDVIFLF